mgnify:CR=1 FL=1
MAIEQTTLFVNEPDDQQPEGACVRWETCGNYPPGHPDTGNMMCDECLDEIRHRDAEAEYDNYAEYLKQLV